MDLVCGRDYNANGDTIIKENAMLIKVSRNVVVNSDKVISYSIVAGGKVRLVTAEGVGNGDDTAYVANGEYAEYIQKFIMAKALGPLETK